MPATDALTVRTQVAEQLQGQTFRSLIDAFVEIDSELNSFNPRSTRFNSTAFMSAMSVAETYYLSPEMHDLALRASTAPDFPDDEAILREDLPSDAGFLYLPGRFRIIELRGRLMIAHAVVWLNNRVWWLCDRRDPEDEINQYLNATSAGANERMQSRWDLMDITEFDFGRPLPHIFGFEAGVLPPDAKVQFRTGPDGQLMMHTDHVINPSGPEGLAPTARRSESLKFLLTIWRLMQQTLAEVVVDDSAGKADRRYALRAKVPDTRVHVIQLRRRESHGTGTGSPLTHRFPVRGHWARRWCGPSDNQILRAVYIHPYIKGPEGTPLIIRERVNALVR